MLKLVIVAAILAVSLGLPANNGVPRLDGRIVGGTDTDIEHHPWQLALLYYLRHYCGGVLFHVRYGLTAAQCLEGAEVSNLAVRAGSTTKSSGGEIVDVRRVHIHPRYNVRTVDYDFAVLELLEPVSVQNAAPIILPSQGFPILEGDIAVISGWGTLSSEGISPELLHEVTVPVISHETCQRAYVNYDVTDRMFCTGVIGVGGKDACQGDAGGPVVINGYLAGLASWGSGCGLPYYPGVNAKIPAITNWIYEVIEI